jgi:uncharacterized protein (TIGR03382 family)
MAFEVPDNGAMSNREPVVFTTGDVIDDTPPTLTLSDEPTRVDYQPADPNMFNSCSDGPAEEMWFVNVPVPEATDDTGIAGYRLFRVNEFGGRTPASVDLHGYATQLTHVAREGGDAVFLIEAFDLAGNVTASEEFVVSLLPTAALGCTAATVSDDSLPLAALALLPLGLALRRRRR